MLAVPRASRPERPVGRRTSEIPVFIEEEPLSTVEKYDSEERTIEAFERIHGLYRCEDRKSAASFVLELARQLVSCEAAVCWLIAEKSPRLEVVAARGNMVLGLEGTMMEFGAGLPGKSVREGRVIRSTSASDLRTYHEPPYNLERRKNPVRSALVTPVMQDGHTVGAIELLHSPRRHGFAQGEANVLSYLCVALAEHLGSALMTGEETH
jgi:GAF domain-containing protein